MIIIKQELWPVKLICVFYNTLALMVSLEIINLFLTINY